MSYPEFFSHLHENEQPQQAESEPALITEEAARPAVSNQQSRQPDLMREQFRDDLSGWIAAMYNELVEDVIGIIPDEDVCQLQNLYEQTLDVIKQTKIDETKLP